MTLLALAVASVFAVDSAGAQVIGIPNWPIAKVARSADTGWLAYGGDAQLTNQSPQPNITRESAPSLHQLWQSQLDGPIIASPLALDGVVYAATESGTVYAVNESTGAIVWSRALGAVDTMSCGTWGISSTGAIDTQRALLYVADADGTIDALSLVTGAVAWKVLFTSRPDTEYVWGGLRLVNSTLYVPVASYCDQPDSLGRPADGRIVAFDVDTQLVQATFDSVPGPNNLGGVWGWGGVSVEPDGSALWTAIGNSVSEDPGCACIVDDAGYGDSVVKLTPDLLPIASSRPSNVPRTNDYDFGATPVLFDVPACGSYAAANNKDGYLYIWKRDALADGPIAEFALGTSSGAPFVGEPSWSARENVLYDASTNVTSGGSSLGDGVSAVAFTTTCNVRVRWQAVTGDGTQPPPLVLGDVVFAAGGSGGWSALDATTGDLLWHEATTAPTLAPPIAVDGRVIAGDYAGVLRAFGT
ncbi:MAG: outer membrane protein assembly factor BamB family protein [Gaiellaceae bacterium]